MKKSSAAVMIGASRVNVRAFDIFYKEICFSMCVCVFVSVLERDEIWEVGAGGK